MQNHLVYSVLNFETKIVCSKTKKNRRLSGIETQKRILHYKEEPLSVSAGAKLIYLGVPPIGVGLSVTSLRYGASHRSRWSRHYYPSRGAVLFFTSPEYSR